MPILFARRGLLALTLACAVPVAALAQTTPIKFQLDWRFEGPAALFLGAAAKGYYKAAGLDVTIDAGNGSGGTVTRVASGTYDMGFADLAALMEFHANNPDAPNKPVAVMMVYNNTPAAVLALKKSGITKPADLSGKKLGAPVFDAGRRAFPIFAKANGVQNVAWTSMDPPLRETMLVRGDIDAITGFSFTSLLNLEARGVKADDVVILPYGAHGVKLYGNVVIATPKIIKENPAAVQRLPARLRQRRQGSDGQPGCGDRLREGPRRHHQRRAREAPPAHGHRFGRRQRRCPRRGLRYGQRAAAGADGLAGVGCVRHQEPGRSGRGLERQLPAAGCRAQHPAAGKEVNTAWPSSISARSGWPTTTNCCARATSPSRTSRCR